MAKAKPPTHPSDAVAHSTRREFKMHRALLWSVMANQAGTLSKSLLEAVMNSIDAGATHCKLEINGKKVKIVDDGRGFASMEEIEKFFETFGQPHQEGDATYGRFRMGRGQMFSFGRNLWLSGPYKLSVDIKPQKGDVAEQGLGYDFSEGNHPVSGCTIEIDLYDKLIPSAVDAVEREISKFVKFAQIPISINGKVVNTLPSEREWDHVTDDAYIDLKEKGSLTLYNLGVFVKEYPAYQFGTGGTIVSRKAVDVNFARNEVIGSCPIFKRISAFVRKNTTTESIKKKKLTGDELESLANRVRTGEVPFIDVFETPMVRTVTGTMLSFSDLVGRIQKFRNRLATTKADDSIGDRLMQRGIALVIDEETITRFGYTDLTEFLKGIAALAKKANRSGGNYRLGALAEILKTTRILEKKDFGNHIKADYDEIPMKELKPAEKFALSMLQVGSRTMGYDISVMYRQARDKDPRWQHSAWTTRFHTSYPMSSCQSLAALCSKSVEPRTREVKVGQSSAADAWTDGESFIWVNRPLLALVGKGVPGMTKLALLMLHEYIHQCPSTGDSNIHNEQFYRLHHDLSIDTPIIGKTVGQMCDRAIRLIRQEQRKPTGALLKFEDQMAEIATGLGVAAGADDVLEEAPDMALAARMKP